MTTRTLSLLTPSGRLTLGSYLGALRPMRERQGDAFYGIADLHALTTDHDPRLLQAHAAEMAALFLAVGLDGATLFRQSHVPAHAQLAYLLECVATTGELGRMVQFKQKSRAGESTRVSLMTYPALMAADILLYRPQAVPVGEDQQQHVELTRDLALRFNRRYGEVFVVPEVVTAGDGTGRVMDLLHPIRKMSKSADAAGSILLLDPPDVVRRKVARAVTDSDVGHDAVRRDRAAKPGVTNLLDVLVACGGSADGVTTYGALKRAVTDAVVAELEPVRQRYAELARDPGHVTEVFARGAQRARAVTEPVLAAATAAIGL
ncbi:tryptophan--tRNA ligase [Nocardioides rubriscoriae]|uniref:tryptophan--tRNA ligase n=1 Tax=Nocardioides rubriscoriae TaxID=642762 RepID=UPI0011DF53F1|nr:tryptophan--tRNA ligase [Nocardioides rubriscoriae]